MPTKTLSDPVSAHNTSINIGSTLDGISIDAEFFRADEGKPVEASLSLSRSGAYQDLVMVRPSEDGKSVKVLVWADADDENYTHQFTIPIILDNN